MLPVPLYFARCGYGHRGLGAVGFPVAYARSGDLIGCGAPFDPGFRALLACRMSEVPSPPPTMRHAGNHEEAVAILVFCSASAKSAGDGLDNTGTLASG